MARRVKINWQRLVFQRLKHLLAVMTKGVEGVFEHGVQSPTREQLLEQVCDEHEQELTLRCYGVATVHVF